MNITYWSDYACPYCYIGETYLKKAIHNLGMDNEILVDMKAFELDPGASKEYTGPTVDRFAKKYGLSLQGARKRIDGISQMGRDAGLDFRYAETRYTNTFDAHRLTRLARQSGDRDLTDRLSERLYRAYFSEGLELSSHDVLLRIAAEEGMDREKVQRLLDSDQFAMDVRLDEREAERCGVHCVPYFVLNGRLAIPGAMPVESMEEAIREALEDDHQTPKEGMTCGPDGCRIADHRA
ncbi:MAG: DsbA family oxidoreductase [Clostridia bacterium]|nr:DsbA family oxidoreductase [Clostridia bacterium]